MTLVGLFAALILIALIVWAVPQLLAAINVPPNVATVIYVCLVVLVVLWLLSTFFGGVPGCRAAMKVRRLTLGSIVATTAAVLMLIVASWNPLCPLFEPWSPQWIALGCWFGDPPVDGN